jgi:phenylalanyl-tRNA synthetase alpha chain
MELPNIDNLINQLKQKINEAINETQIIEIRNAFINKHLSPLYEELKYASVHEKKALGNSLNLIKNKINQLVEHELQVIQLENENKQHIVDYDININPALVLPGSFTPISLIIREAMTYFEKMGFDIIMGNEIVDTKYNFDNLNIDMNHPARNASDSYFINVNTMLRAHCTATSAQALEDNLADDIRIVTFGNVYRNDDDDATHSHQFSQIDIVWVRNNLSIRNLKWLIDGLLKHLFYTTIKTRYRLSYFPFTEPSFEVDIQCPKCHGKGCPLCKQTG